jgi:hypothetical protein
MCNYCWSSNVHVGNMLKHRLHGITETVIWQWDVAFMVLTMKFTAFNINKNQVPAKISWTFQTKIFHKKWWYSMQVFEHTMFNFKFIAKMRIPSSTYKVSSHVVWTLALMKWERLKFFSLQKAICRIKNKVYHKPNGHIFITCTKHLTKSKWLYFC